MFVTSVGMSCPVGLNGPAAAAAIRCGIAKFGELPFFQSSGEPIIGAMTPGLDPYLRPGARLLEMLAAAVKECLEGGDGVASEATPVLVCLPQPDRPGGPAPMDADLIDSLSKKLGRRFHAKLSQTIRSGHAAGFEALRAARALLQRPDVSQCLICAGDTFISPATLAWLERDWRLKTEENSDGVIPGEAAAA